MKKIIILGLTGTILAGGYAGLWHYNAGNLKNEFNGELDKLSKQAKDSGTTVAIASVNTSGFPGSIKINLNQLSLDNKDFKAKMDGISIERGISSNKLGLTDWTDIDIKAGEYEFIAKTGKDNYFNVQFSDSQFVNFVTGKLSLRPFKDDVDMTEALKKFKSFEWKNASDHELVDKKSGETLVKHGPSNVSLAVDVIDSATTKVAFKALLKDFEFTEAFDKWVNKLTPDGQIKASNLHDAGKTNLDVDITYSGLTNMDLLGKQDVNFAFEIAKYDSKSALGEGITRGSMQLKVGKDKNPVDGKIKLNATYKFTPEFAKYMKNSMAAALENLNTLEKSAAKTEEAEDLAILKEIFESFDQLFPNMDKLGEIKYALDIDFNVPERKINLTDISFSSEKYAVTIKGHGNLTDLTKPDVKAELFIKNHEEMASNLFDFSTELVKVLKSKNRLPADFVIDPSLKQKITEFLVKLAGKQAADSKDLKINFEVSGDKIKIGEMDYAEAMMSLMMLIAPQAQ